MLRTRSCPQPSRLDAARGSNQVKCGVPDSHQHYVVQMNEKISTIAMKFETMIGTDPANPDGVEVDVSSMALVQPQKFNSTNTYEELRRFVRIDADTIKYNLTKHDFSMLQFLGTGHHAEVYAIPGGKHVIKVLTSAEQDEIPRVRAGINIMKKFMVQKLIENHLLPEVIIYDENNILLYSAFRMGGESQEVSDHDYSTTKLFFKDAATAINFLSKNNILYGNPKPCNYLYILDKSGRPRFFLQDYGSIKVGEKNDSGVKLVRISSNLYDNLFLVRKKLYAQYLENQNNHLVVIKHRNLAGLIFTVMGFHEKISSDGINKVAAKYQDNVAFTLFLQNLGIETRFIQDFYRLCYGQQILDLDTLNTLEQACKNLT